MLLAKALIMAVEEKDSSFELMDVVTRAKQYCKVTVPNATRIELAAMLGTKLRDLLGVTFHESELQSKCTCHERDGSYVCDHCFAQGHRGHMQKGM
jgi:hypothetical protein